MRNKSEAATSLKESPSWMCPSKHQFDQMNLEQEKRKEKSIKRTIGQSQML